MPEPKDLPQAGDLCPHCDHPLAWIPEHGYPDWSCGIITLACVGVKACGYGMQFWIAHPDTDESEAVPQTETKPAQH